MGTKPPLRDGSLTHAMCPGCAEYFERQWSGLTHAEYLERFDFPVILMQEEGRVVAANRAAGVAGPGGGRARSLRSAGPPGAAAARLVASSLDVENLHGSVRKTPIRASGSKRLDSGRSSGRRPSAPLHS